MSRFTHAFSVAWTAFWQWFRQQRLLVKVGVIGAAVVVVGILGGTFGSSGSSDSSRIAGAASTHTATAGSHGAIQPAQSPIPTALPTATISPTATATPVPTSTSVALICTDAGCSPWGYKWEGTSVIWYDQVPVNFCDYFKCISNFGNSKGYVVQCGDKLYSTAGGRSGACSQHKSVLHTLYKP